MSKSSSLNDIRTSNLTVELIPCLACWGYVTRDDLYMFDGEIGLCRECYDIAKFANRRRQKKHINPEDFK